MLSREFFRYFLKCSIRNILKLLWCFRIRPNRIILLNECNFSYADSPKYIAEYLNKHNPDQLQIIFPIKKLPQQNIPHVKFVRFSSLPYFYYALTAKVFVTNDGGISYLPLRSQQYVINTWHGGGAYKRVSTSLSQSKYYRIDQKLAARNTDIFLSSSKKFTHVMSEAMLIPPHKFWEIGLPRNDLLVESDDKLKKDLKEKIGISPSQKLVLYCPTFRKETLLGKNMAFNSHIDIEKVIYALNLRFKGSWNFGYRLHPSIKIRPQLNHNIWDLSDYPDIQELLLVSDILITDYSSCMWDFMLTGNPVFIYAEDFEEYYKGTGFYTPMSEWPFLQAQNTAELVNNILAFDEQTYANACYRHYSQLGGTETGHSTALIGNLIVKMCCAQGTSTH